MATKQCEHWFWGYFTTNHQFFQNKSYRMHGALLVLTLTGNYFGRLADIISTVASGTDSGNILGCKCNFLELCNYQ